jgi:uncharacterized membrane protein YsdA (DUF1294 family)
LPSIDQSVSYSPSTDRQGRECAIQVSLSGKNISGKQGRNSVLFSLVVAAVFLAIVGCFVLAGKIPVLILYLYLFVSLLTFIIYARDKAAARNGRWRTKENTLHIWSLLGGWPGAIVAQQTLRHKSKKASFRFVFWLTVFLNCGAFYWLLTPGGGAIWHRFMSGVIDPVMGSKFVGY